MRTQAIIMIAIASLFTIQANAFTGPKNKNIKASERLAGIGKTELVKIEIIKGPEAKNTTANARLENVEKTTVQKTEILKGPKAKNHKPFRN